MRVHAGVYNRDYAEYKKGVDAYEKLSQERPTDQSLRIHVTCKDAAKLAEYEASSDPLKTIFEGKLARYKAMYNQLPRDYFKRR